MLLLNHQQLRRACVAPANVASKTTIFQHLLTFLRPRFLRIGTRLPTTRPRRDRDEALCAVSKVKQQFCVIMGLQKKTYNIQLALSEHNTMAEALVAKAPGRVLCSEEGNWALCVSFKSPSHASRLAIS